MHVYVPRIHLYIIIYFLSYLNYVNSFLYFNFVIFFMVIEFSFSNLLLIFKRFYLLYTTPKSYWNISGELTQKIIFKNRLVLSQQILLAYLHKFVRGESDSFSKNVRSKVLRENNIFVNAIVSYISNLFNFFLFFFNPLKIFSNIVCNFCNISKQNTAFSTANFFFILTCWEHFSQI